MAKKVKVVTKVAASLLAVGDRVTVEEGAGALAPVLRLNKVDLVSRAEPER